MFDLSSQFPSLRVVLYNTRYGHMAYALLTHNLIFYYNGLRGTKQLSLQRRYIMQIGKYTQYTRREGGKKPRILGTPTASRACVI